MQMAASTLTHENAMEVKRQLKAAIAAGDAVWVLSGLERLDSCAVALVLEWKRMVAEAGLTPEIKGIPEKLRSLFTVYGLTELLES